MSRLPRINPDTIQAHIEAHCARRGLKLGWDAFCAMEAGKASISSMARTFDVEWRIMDNWLDIYKAKKERDHERANGKTIKKN